MNNEVVKNNNNIDEIPEGILISLDKFRYIHNNSHESVKQFLNCMTPTYTNYYLTFINDSPIPIKLYNFGKYSPGNFKLGVVILMGQNREMESQCNIIFENQFENIWNIILEGVDMSKYKEIDHKIIITKKEDIITPMVKVRNFTSKVSKVIIGTVIFLPIVLTVVVIGLPFCIHNILSDDTNFKTSINSQFTMSDSQNFEFLNNLQKLIKEHKELKDKESEETKESEEITNNFTKIV